MAIGVSVGREHALRTPWSLNLSLKRRCRNVSARGLIGTMSAHIGLLQIRDSSWRKRFAG